MEPIYNFTAPAKDLEDLRSADLSEGKMPQIMISATEEGT